MRNNFNNDNLGNENFLDAIFNNENTEILLFLVVFLLLFTTYGRR